MMDLAHAIFEPAGDGPHPTIVALHGFGAGALDLLGLAPHVARGRFLWIAPQGPERVALDFAGAAGAVGYGWFPLTLSNPPTPLSVAEAVSRARGFIDAACARYAVDRSRLAVLGFSQGGVIAYALALADPSRYRALVALSSWLSDDLVRVLPKLDRSRLRCRVHHGTADEVIMIQRGRDSASRLRALGVDVDYHEYPMGHEIDAHSLADLSTWIDRAL